MLIEKWKIGQVFDVKLGKMLSPKAKNGDQYPYLTNQNVRWGSFDLSELNEMHFSEGEKERYSIRQNDVVICEGGEIGRCAVWTDEDPIFYQKALHRLRPKTQNQVDAFFFQYQFQSIVQSGRIKGFVGESSIAHLTREKLLSIPIPLPPLPEQKKIARILSTWDKAIELLEKKIAAKEKLKKGLMQQLLTGKKRFKDFGKPAKDGELPEGWKEVKIDDVIMKQGRSFEWDDDRPYPLISVRRRSGGLFHRDTLWGRQIKTKQLVPVEEGDFLISKMQIVHGASGLVTDAFSGMFVSGSYIICRSREPESLDIEYFNFLSRTPRFYHICYTSSYGVVIEKMTFDYSDFVAHRIMIPALVEQKAIVSCFKAFEKEVNVLKEKLRLTREQKRGLMQQLLTGKKRVKV